MSHVTEMSPAVIEGNYMSVQCGINDREIWAYKQEHNGWQNI